MLFIVYYMNHAEYGNYHCGEFDGRRPNSFQEVSSKINYWIWRLRVSLVQFNSKFSALFDLNSWKKITFIFTSSSALTAWETYIRLNNNKMSFPCRKIIMLYRVQFYELYPKLEYRKINVISYTIYYICVYKSTLIRFCYKKYFMKSNILT